MNLGFTVVYLAETVFRAEGGGGMDRLGTTGSRSIGAAGGLTLLELLSSDNADRCAAGSSMN